MVVGSDDEEYYDYDYSPSSSYCHIAVHRIIQAVAQEAAVIHQRAILPENIIVVVHQKAVQILRAAVRTAIAIPVAALHIQEALQAAAPVQRNIIIFIR